VLTKELDKMTDFESEAARAKAQLEVLKAQTGASEELTANLTS